MSTHALRYYEKEGLIAVPRDAHGTRVFDEESISSARFIATCRQTGMSLADIRTILSNPDDHALSIDVMPVGLTPSRFFRVNTVCTSILVDDIPQPFCEPGRELLVVSLEAGVLNVAAG